MQALILVRLGQELGSDSPAAFAVSVAVEWALKVGSLFSP